MSTVPLLPPVNKNIVTLLKLWSTSKHEFLTKLKQISAKNENPFKTSIWQFAGIIMYLIEIAQTQDIRVYDLNITKNSLWEYYSPFDKMFVFKKDITDDLVDVLHLGLEKAKAKTDTSIRNIMFAYIYNKFAIQNFTIIEEQGTKYITLNRSNKLPLKIIKIDAKAQKTIFKTYKSLDVYKYIKDNQDNYSEYSKEFENITKDLTQVISFTENAKSVTRNTLQFMYHVGTPDARPSLETNTITMNCAFLDIIPWSLTNKTKFFAVSGRDLLYSRTGKAMTTLVDRELYLLTSISTSVDTDTPIEFMSNASCPVLYIFEIPPGSLGYVFPVSNISAHPYEKEIILPISTKLKITSTDVTKHYDSYDRHYQTVYATVLPSTEEERSIFKAIFTCKDSKNGGRMSRKKRGSKAQKYKGGSGSSPLDDAGFVDTDELQDIIIESFIMRSMNKLAEEFKLFANLAHIKVIDAYLQLSSRIAFLKINTGIKNPSSTDTSILAKDVLTGINDKDNIGYVIIAYVSYNINKGETDKGYLSFEDFKKWISNDRPNSRVFSEENLSMRFEQDQDLSAVDLYSLEYYDLSAQNRERFILQKKAHAFLYFKYFEIDLLVKSIEDKTYNKANSFVSSDLYHDNLRIKALKGLQYVIQELKKEKDVLYSLRF
jgi:hypothetical protein